MNAQGQKVDMLAVMQLAADMLDTGEFEVDRETGRQLEAAIPLVAELIKAAKNIQSRVAEGVSPDPEEWDWFDASLARIGGAQS